VEYDTLPSLLGQFGNAEIGAVAAKLDRKLKALFAAALQ
jgi:hypothetical protein